MLRAALLALVAANLLFFAFTRGAFDGLLGLHALGDREPERLARQVRPETITLLPTRSASAPTDAGICFEAGPIAAADAAQVEAVLRASLPPGSWSDTARGESGGAVSHTYRVASADADLATRLTALRLDAFGRGFNRCAGSDAVAR